MKFYKVKIWSLFSLIIFFFVTFSGLFLSKVYDLQFNNAEYFQEQALSYRVKTEVLESRRGNIYDKNLVVLASSTNSYDIGIYPNKIDDIKNLTSLLSSLLNIDTNLLLTKLVENDRFFYAARNVNYQIGNEIKTWRLQGIEVIPSSKRIIHEASIEKIIGKVDTDQNGIEGLELYYDSVLRGIDGKIQYEAAPDGTIIPQAKIATTQPIHGEDLILTIDSEYQYLSQNLCVEALKITEAFNCSIVFANANTGEILISVEEENPNENLNINLISARGQYEPGSSFKIFSVGLALDKGIINENTVFLVDDYIEIIEGSCNNGYQGYKGCYKDFLKHEPYNLTVKEIIERSSNVGAILATENLEISQLEEFLKSLGFAQKTGVELPGESKGRFSDYKTCKTCLSSLAIGYSANVTQLQMVKAYSTIVNGGKGIELTFIKKPQNFEYQNQVISEELSFRMKNLLINVVEGENGTGRSVRKENLVIGGKTGTSRTHIEGLGYSNSRFNTSFTGFVETENGPIVGSVILWGASISPYTEYVTGGSTAAPIFKSIIEYLIPGSK